MNEFHKASLAFPQLSNIKTQTLLFVHQRAAIQLERAPARKVTEILIISVTFRPRRYELESSIYVYFDGETFVDQLLSPWQGNHYSSLSFSPRFKAGGDFENTCVSIVLVSLFESAYYSDEPIMIVQLCLGSE